jgi:hypothetical protein
VGKQRLNHLKDLLAAGLSAQDAASLLHLVALLSAAVPGSCGPVALDLFPGWPRPLTGKHVKPRPQVEEDLITGDARDIEQAQRGACIASGARMGNASACVLATSTLLLCHDLPGAGHERLLFV